MHFLGHFFITYGYILAFIVMVFEGPLATMIMAALASAGYFNIVIVFFLALSADLISDYVFYFIGYRGAKGIILLFSKIFRFDVRRIDTFGKWFRYKGDAAIFLAKILPGLVPPVFIAAGMYKYSLRKLYSYALPAGILWTGALVAIGYFLGHRVVSIEKLLSKTGIVLSIIVIALILYQYAFGKIIARKALEKEEAKLNYDQNEK